MWIMHTASWNFPLQRVLSLQQDGRAGTSVEEKRTFLHLVFCVLQNQDFVDRYWTAHCSQREFNLSERLATWNIPENLKVEEFVFT